MNRIHSIVILIFLLTVITLHSYCYDRTDHNNFGESAAPYTRIISLSPSVTETLFALGLGDRIAGVTRFCLYPPEAQKLPHVGGYLDPNYEAITALKPDFVILRPEHEEVRNYLDAMQVPHLAVGNRNIEEILNAIAEIGKACGADERAQELIDNLSGRMKEIREMMRAKARPSVLISVGRPLGSGSIREVFAAAEGTFFDELIGIAGGENVLRSRHTGSDFPQLSAEGILSLNPDIIVELIPVAASQNLTEAGIIREWQSLSSATAVRNNRVFLISGDYAVIPGPRFILLLEDLVRILHPEINIPAID